MERDQTKLQEKCELLQQDFDQLHQERDLSQKSHDMLIVERSQFLKERQSSKSRLTGSCKQGNVSFIDAVCVLPSPTDDPRPFFLFSIDQINLAKSNSLCRRLEDLCRHINNGYRRIKVSLWWYNRISFFPIAMLSDPRRGLNTPCSCNLG